jgi:hypothetical protein
MKLIAGVLISFCIIARSIDAATTDLEASADSYWQSHSLIYAEIETNVASEQGASAQVVILRPKLSLSGHFDPGKIPELKVRCQAKSLVSILKTLHLGQMAIVLLVRKGDEYDVSPDVIDFMPDDHSAISAVKDFEDPKVQSTLTAVQKLRDAKSKDAKSSP